MIRAGFLVVLALLLAPRAAHGEEAAAVERPYCFVGRPQCRYILLAEFHADWFVNRSGSSAIAQDLSLGVMTKSGFGVTAGARFFGFAPDTYWLVRGRYRYWLSDKAALDGSLAPMIAFGDETRPGVNVQVAAELADQIGVFIDADLFRTSTFPGSETEFTVGLGLRFANFAALPGAAFGVLYALVRNGGD